MITRHQPLLIGKLKFIRWIIDGSNVQQTSNHDPTDEYPLDTIWMIGPLDRSKQWILIGSVNCLSNFYWIDNRKNERKKNRSLVHMNHMININDASKPGEAEGLKSGDSR